MILAGDIGGTNTRLALFNVLRGSLNTPVKSKIFPSEKYDSLTSILKEFLGKDEEQLISASFGVAGPIINGSVATTNLPWSFSETTLANDLNCPKVRLINDLVAIAYTLPYFAEEQIECIYEGNNNREKNTFAVIGSGTGFGQATTTMFNDDPVVIASEGGHVDFAPVTDEHVDLLNFLCKKLGKRISVERVCSGQGIQNIMDYLINGAGYKTTPEIEALMDTDDVAKLIGKAAVDGTDEASVKAIDIYSEILGSQAGSVVLTYLCGGGLFLGGGIPSKVAKFIKTEKFLKFYLNKGRLSPSVESVPIFMIKDELAGLQGASRLGLITAEEVARERRTSVN